MPASVDVVFTPDLLPFSNLMGKTVVVADILRATTTITVALANGASTISPVLTPENALHFAENDSDILIGGERQGVKVDGFHLGNSPREYTETVVRGKSIVLTTTNGTRTLQACQSAERVLIGSFLNLRAVVDDLMQAALEIVFACAGCEGGFCLEDTVFAGACVDALKSDGRSANVQLTDAAEVAHLLYREHNHDLVGMLRNCCHGKFLAGIGLGDDLLFCGHTNVVDIVPRQIDGRIVE